MDLWILWILSDRNSSALGWCSEPGTKYIGQAHEHGARPTCTSKHVHNSAARQSAISILFPFGFADRQNQPGFRAPPRLATDRGPARAGSTPVVLFDRERNRSRPTRAFPSSFGRRGSVGAPFFFAPGALRRVIRCDWDWPPNLRVTFGAPIWQRNWSPPRRRAPCRPRQRKRPTARRHRRPPPSARPGPGPAHRVMCHLHLPPPWGRFTICLRRPPW